ncbi:MAG: cysteine--tRNA ligase [Desulfurococcales archaeon]|nr:cysteine--tRNA ligase [Desulfurococcales archaeon]
MVSIKVFNTLGRRKEEFQPNNPPLVKMYTCGPTVYDHTHIGHARMYVSFDGIKRYLQLRGYKVIHVQNITDIDDKIIKKSIETGRPWNEIVDEYTREYLELLEELRVRPHYNPRVTMHIGDIIKFIQRLVEKGYAYESNGSVYFDVDKYEYYGELSGRLSKDLWGQEEEFVSEKRHPYDFVLWKRRKPMEPYWDSPWGPGRPGWHIECSVMSTRYLGERIDIHGGGEDLVFPHHENEKAQSEAALGVRPWVKYWLHTGYLTIGGEKMSKSLKNIIPLKDALRELTAPILRLWILSVHYRSRLEYNETIINQARKLYDRLVSSESIIEKKLLEASKSHYDKDEDVERMKTLSSIILGFHEALSDDFNFGEANKYLWEFTRFVHAELQYSESGALALVAKEFSDHLNAVYSYRTAGEGGISFELFKEVVDLLIEVRSELRKNKMYELSDKIRDKLGSLGITVLDYRNRSEWVLRK